MSDRKNAESSDEFSDVVLKCPECQGEMSFIGSWTVRAVWGYREVRTYECASHGPMFLSPQKESARRCPSDNVGDCTDKGDRDSLITAPRRPRPTLDADAIAISEPD
jgi:hypothetical protein